ncbi:helix-turn-helix domain-containing protein [Rubrobacter tropicus]|uniref:Helix-turn-helix domain-containing protein n=1 Tax=Rubrobacter tropicus TaxID=2653851 RepID=A0A6G8QBX8_9ACTN|nr:helix-turn-helix domain-containing protein [Rubrobacter tropicus]QIN83942.1 helix-turn-helix domain-containing protein [Rubrobacter tropicus]
MAVSQESGRGIELLGAEEVAGVLGVKESTIWRWCREGRLPCLKVGKHWRVRRDALDDFLREKERPTTLVGQLGSFLRVPDNVLAIAQNLELLHRLDAAFFRVGEARDGLLVKFHGGEDSPAEELIARFEENGLEAGRLQRERRLLMRPEENPLGGREDQLGRLIEEGVGEGRTVWASFDWVKQVGLETALEQQERLAGLVDAKQLVVKTAALEEAVEGWSSVALRRAQSKHSGTILAYESGLSLSRVTPMPAL